MDRILLTTQDVTELMLWRDENKEKVRNLPNPIPYCEILLTDIGIKLKCIRKQAELTIYLYENNVSFGYMRFNVSDTNQLVLQPKNDRLKRVESDKQSAITIYCSIMALISYGHTEIKEYQETGIFVKPKPSPIDTNHQKKKNSKTKKESIIFIIKKDKQGKIHAVNDSKRSPKGEFSVRGHFRKYKNGKSVWIDAYTKGNGKKVQKTYLYKDRK